MTQTIFVGVITDDAVFMGREASRILEDQPNTVVEIDGPTKGYTFWPAGFEDDEETKEANAKRTLRYAI